MNGREIDPLPQCNKFSTGKFVALIELSNDFEEICSRQVGRPRIPLPEFRFEPGEIWGSGRLIGLQDLPQVLRSHRIHSPELQHFPPGNDAVANPDEFIKHRQRSCAGEIRQGGRRSRDVDRRAGEHQLADLGRKPRYVCERHPAALAKANQINRAPIYDEDRCGRRDNCQCRGNASPGSQNASRPRTIAVARRCATRRLDYVLV